MTGGEALIPVKGQSFEQDFIQGSVGHGVDLGWPLLEDSVFQRELHLEQIHGRPVGRVGKFGHEHFSFLFMTTDSIEDHRMI